MNTAFYSSPIGNLEIRIQENYITRITFIDSYEPQPPSGESSALMSQCLHELDLYFSGQLKHFTFPIYQEGTVFQKTVWNQLQTIPYGKTISYADLARQLSDIKKIRAVGTTNGKNNLAIVVPCHRVIGSNQQLTGYAGGLWRKRWLLEHEAKHAPGVRQLNLI